ncbi:MgtC/SapB family protein [Candidatus Woesearchaeota archaeon]|nr:MgtC/SapB family protein [Candidatus Woesearchaeota archaeon]
MAFNLLTPHEPSFLFSFVLSLIAGILIGAERESRRKVAGISTHTFVIMGAMVFTMLSSRVDPESTSRIAAQIVTGIGFLGAGLIIKEGANVRNLTTAASIWFSSAIGMALGFGYYWMAIISAIACVLIPRIPHFQKNRRG